MLLNELLKIIPRKFNAEKHKRLYINVENVDRSHLKRVENIALKGFRVAIISTLKYSGYRVDERVTQNAENLGPNPDILWLLFRGGDRVVVVIGDSTFQTLSEKALEKFKDVYTNYLVGKGVDVANTLFASLDNLESYVLRKLFLAEIRIVKASER